MVSEIVSAASTTPLLCVALHSGIQCAWHYTLESNVRGTTIWNPMFVALHSGIQCVWHYTLESNVRGTTLWNPMLVDERK